VSRFILFYTSGVENKRKLAPASKSRVKDSIKTLLKTWPELPGLDVRRLSAADCKAWAKRALEVGSGFVAPNTKTKRTGMSASGYNKCVDALRGILEKAQLEGALHPNPASQVEKEKPKKKKLELPTIEQFHAIAKTVAASSGRWSQDAADLLRLLAYSGARLREGTSLRWNHVDEKKGLLTIPGTKTDASQDRLVPLFPPLRALLSEIRTRRGAEAANAPIARVGECMVSLKNACRRIGVKPMDHHDLRHLFATRCIESGVDIPTVSKWLGHADGGVLAMKTYGHLRQEHSLAQGAKVVMSAVPLAPSRPVTTAV
jgi:integrase